MISRRDFVVQRYTVNRPQFQLLSQLCEGQSVGDAIQSVAAELDDLDELAGLLQEWFAFWGREAFFVAINS